MPAKAYWIRMRPSPEAATRTPTRASDNPLIRLIVHCGCRTKNSGPRRTPVNVAHFVATHRSASVGKKYDAVSQMRNSAARMQATAEAAGPFGSLHVEFSFELPRPNLRVFLPRAWGGPKNDANSLWSATDQLVVPSTFAK
jgi:hypothetical protein